MEHPARSIQACLDRLDIGYVDLMLLHNPDPNDVIPFIQDLGIVMQGWYPLGGRGHMGELLGDSVISEIAGAHGVSSAQVILRWNLQKLHNIRVLDYFFIILISSFLFIKA